jgi:hypothetical protein
MRRVSLVGAVVLAFVSVMFSADQAKPEKKAGVLTLEEAQKVLPASVFYAGQTAPVQARNSGGFRTASGKLVLAGLVDSSGYSSGIAEKYQGFLISEVKLQIGGQTLPPGAYGIGAVAGDKFVVTDLGANEVLTTASKSDAALKRPVPLKFVADGASYRLYLGKKYVTVQSQDSGK